MDVGSELSGTIQRVFVDYNNEVKQGQELARLDTSKLQDQIVRSRAALVSSEAGVLQADATANESRANLQRHHEHHAGVGDRTHPGDRHRLAIGALEHEVLLQFLIEAVVLSSLGGLVGILLATGASIGMASLMQVPYLFHPGINLASFVISAGIGVIFGFLPARRAAQLDPIEALRHE